MPNSCFEWHKQGQNNSTPSPQIASAHVKQIETFKIKVGLRNDAKKNEKKFLLAQTLTRFKTSSTLLLGSETEFSSLGVVTKTIYKDDRTNLIPGQPENREYNAWFMKKDQKVGQQSDTVGIVA